MICNIVVLVSKQVKFISGKNTHITFVTVILHFRSAGLDGGGGTV